MDKVRRLKLSVLLGVPFLLLIMFLLREQLIWLGAHMGPCWFHEITGLNCPGCGNTRAVTALLHMHPFLALHNNPAIPILFVSGLGFYIELALDLGGKKVRLMPRSYIFWFGLLALLMIFYVVRNFFPILGPIA